MGVSPDAAWLHAATSPQVWWAAANQRLFDVSVNGAVVLANVDPYALAGAKFTAVMREVTLTATSNTLVVSLQGKVDNAALAALEVSSWHNCSGFWLGTWPQTSRCQTRGDDSLPLAHSS